MIYSNDKWLSEPTRQKALKKLDKMRKYIGGVPYATDKRKLDEYYNDLVFDSTDSYREMSIKSGIYQDLSLTNILAIFHLRRRQFLNLISPNLDEFDSPQIR